MFTVSTHSERSTLSCKGLGELVIDTSSPPLAGGTGSTRRARARRALKFRVLGFRVFTGHGVRLYRGGYRYAFTPPLSIAHAITLRASPPQGHPDTTLLGFRVCPQTPGRLKYFLSRCAQSRRRCNETKRDRNADRREALRPSARKKRRPV